MSENQRTRPPLAGVTVLEIGQFMAAPFAAMQLADLGARVIKIENPDGGDGVRGTGPFVNGESSPFVRLNRNKESVTLNLKDDRDNATLRRLVSAADVLIENMRPGAMKRLGLDYEALSAINPRLIYASASGWGQDGPLAGHAGLDIMAQARSGLMSITGHPGGPPAKVGVPVCDLTCGLYIALSVTAALRERDTSGRGQHIDVSLMEAGTSLAIWEAGMYFGDGTVPHPNGSAHQTSAPYQAIRTSDGHATVGATTPKNWAAFCKVLGLEELQSDERFTDSYSRVLNREVLIELIERASAEWTTADLIAALDDVGVPCAPIHDYPQVFNDPVLVDRGFFWDSDHPTAGTVRMLGSPMRFSRTPTARDHAGPRLGDATDTVLAEIAQKQESDQ